MSIEPVLREWFRNDGRRPESQEVHYSGRGVVIRAIDYFSPEDEYTPENLKHLVFIRPQVFMFTPEEVYNPLAVNVDWSKYDGAAIVCLGKSGWLRSFDHRHLVNCRHFEVMFYDESLDVICEGIEAKSGGYAE